jgi:phosphomannomutase
MIEKVFKAYDVRATYPEPLNEAVAFKVGYGSAKYLLEQDRSGLAKPNTVVVGRDMRPSSPSLSKALSDGIRAAGMDVLDVGLIDTSFIYFAINDLGAAGGIQGTASHNPVQYNGFKISGRKAAPIGSGSGLEKIREIATGVDEAAARKSISGAYAEIDLWDAYRKHVLGFLELKRPLTVVVDGSNGMAGLMVPKVFYNVPNLTIVPMLFEMPGTFVHEPNPLVDSNLKMLKDKMAAGPCDLGACFDGDADRCFFVDEKRNSVACDLLTALMARDFLQRPEGKNAAVVYDLRCSHVVPDEIRAGGGTPVRERVGHAFIKKTMAAKKAVFGGELSGHFYFAGNWYADSGAIAFARVLSILSAQPKPLSELIKPLARYHQTGEINFKVADKAAVLAELKKRYASGTIDELDGVTVDLDGWWFNVRPSNTEPLLRLNLEANTPELRKAKLAELQTLLGEPAEGH